MTNPTRLYLDHLKALYLTKPGGYTRKRLELAATIGVTGSRLYNYSIPNQNAKANIIIALKAELATNGAIPANSLCPDADEILRLAKRVLKRRGEEPKLRGKVRRIRDQNRKGAGS